MCNFTCLETSLPVVPGRCQLAAEQEGDAWALGGRFSSSHVPGESLTSLG